MCIHSLAAWFVHRVWPLSTQRLCRKRTRHTTAHSTPRYSPCAPPAFSHHSLFPHPVFMREGVALPSCDPDVASPRPLTPPRAATQIQSVQYHMQNRNCDYPSSTLQHARSAHTMHNPFHPYFSFGLCMRSSRPVRGALFSL